LGAFGDFKAKQYLVGGDWNHGIYFDFPYIGNVSIRTDELVFFRGDGLKPPTRQVV